MYLIQMLWNNGKEEKFMTDWEREELNEERLTKIYEAQYDFVKNIFDDCFNSLYTEFEIDNSEAVSIIQDMLYAEYGVVNTNIEIAKLNENRYGLSYDKKTILDPLEEEFQELKDAIENDDEHEICDGAGDIVVTALGIARKYGYNPDLCMRETIKEIKSRRQDPTQKREWAMNGKIGKWKKDKTQPLIELYKADYSKCKIK